ncbi:repressor protein [Candidatus Wolfebacteria bacterium RIFOXYB2_FULL_49_7]|uniref:Repressor protein n=1 Tax=Candidatus Wolfebacteria bacterium RIFOXYB1_FULL_54_12 TaxID=1802559 RepID=A0A1F8DZG4_9BACT|nr:MAG: repressor protein [Candidatus Wolfebacteria bacterium RIFOXYB1_FULL_54_12]OGM94072.1 MAG: repressor protein [Candidatus Wolfebacteria bacterium RIFOXYB2_FULL_49_7]
MAIHYGAYIKKMRERVDLSQDFVAKKIGVSRPTITQIEKDERELTLAEAQGLADLFDMRIEEFLAKKEVSEPIVVLSKAAAKKKGDELDIRINVPQKNLKKFKEVLLYVLEKVGAKPNIGETAIYKLLYFIDFDFYEKYEEQLIGATYIKNNYGPTPVEFAKIVEDMEKRGELERIKSKYFDYEQKKYLPRRSSDLAVLSALETSHIDDVLNRLSDKSAKELSDYSHGDVPWAIAEDKKVISYESVFYRDKNYSVRSYDDEL